MCDRFKAQMRCLAWMLQSLSLCKQYMENINEVVTHMGNCKMLTNSKLQGAVWPCYAVCVISVIHTAIIRTCRQLTESL